VNVLRSMAANIFETLLRFLPFPCRTGLVKIGNPKSDSPVFLTCNYHLTVQRVRRALKEMDAYLLVANSRGINVWCASAGGHLTNHDVISVLKTSGIEELVKRREVILPQLAAVGIEARIIKKRTGWRVIWGPVYAREIPDFMKNKQKIDKKKREVEFSWPQRLEMAIAWAFPMSLMAGVMVIIFFPGVFIPLILLIWGLSLAIFLFFPLYSSWLIRARKSVTFSLLLWSVILIILAVYTFFATNISWNFFIRWGFMTFIFVFILTIDLKGSTPVFKGELSSRLKIIIDEEKCKGAAFCETVCPRNCYEVDRERRIAALPGAERCIQCGACIIQCPFDALHFQSPKGEMIPPEKVRKYKQNYLGQRLVRSAGNERFD
jgi:NAD-dependent dihydropyrimidine dehydrogenase PreA subunit